jgi:hypothetical protein
MKNFRKAVLAALVTVALGMLAGCGSGSSSTPQPVTKEVTAAVVAAPPGSPTDSVQTAAAVYAVAPNGAGTTIPAGTVISPSFDGKLAAGNVTLNIVTPPSGSTIIGMKSPTGRILAAAAGAVDISIAGINGFTVPAPGLTVTVPVSACPSATGVAVTVVRYDGSSSNFTGTCSNNLVTVSGITQFSSVIAAPVFVTGS